MQIIYPTEDAELKPNLKQSIASYQESFLRAKVKGTKFHNTSQYLGHTLNNLAFALMDT